jgi:hypothetical protein
VKNSWKGEYCFYRQNYLAFESRKSCHLKDAYSQTAVVLMVVFFINLLALRVFVVKKSSHFSVVLCGEKERIICLRLRCAIKAFNFIVKFDKDHWYRSFDGTSCPLPYLTEKPQLKDNNIYNKNDK